MRPIAALFLTLALLTGSTAEARKEPVTENTISFTEVNRLIYIRVMVNDIATVALVDSGATGTSVDSSIIGGKGCAYRNMLTASGERVTTCERKAEIKAGHSLIATNVTSYAFPLALGEVKVILSLHDLANGGRVLFDYENQVLVVSPKK